MKFLMNPMSPMLQTKPPPRLKSLPWRLTLTFWMSKVRASVTGSRLKITSALTGLLDTCTLMSQLVLVA